MRLAIIGRSEYLYESARLLLAHGHQLALIVTSKEAPEYLYKASDFEALAEESGAKFLYTPKINSESIVQQITALGKIDLAVSINYAGVIAQEVIDLFPMGILNAHGGDLPRYRGNACMAWAILNHENRVGLCIHKMIGGELDSGDVLARKHLPIDIDTRVGQTFEWMRREIPGMMLEAVQRLQADPLQLFEQQSKNPVEALRTYPRLPEDGCIDWNRSTEDVLRLINASSEPFSGAFSDLNGQRMIVWRAALADDDERYLAIPGQVARIEAGGAVLVIAGTGKLRLLEVEIDGRRTDPAAFVLSIRTRLR